MQRIGKVLSVFGTLVTATLVGCGSDKVSSALTDPSVAAHADAGGDAAQHAGPAYDFSAIAPEMQAFLESSQTAKGASIIIVHRDYGVLYKQAFGTHKLDTISLIASASKLISASVLMTQYDDGKLDLDAPISKYIEACAARPGLTATHLLSNTSGMPGLTETIANITTSKLVCQFNQADTLQSCAKTICSVDLGSDLKPPGTTVRYGGAQWTLAGGLAEVLSGRAFAQLLRERIIEPCGLQTLRYGNHYLKAAISGDPLSYPTFFQDKPANVPATDNPSIEGGGMCNLDDYAKILLMHLHDGMCGDKRVLSKKAVEQMRVDRLGGIANPNILGYPIKAYGFGWWIEPESEVYSDPGLYGAEPWIDLRRGYGAYISLETNFAEGAKLQARIRPIVENALDKFK